MTTAPGLLGYPLCCCRFRSWCCSSCGSWVGARPNGRRGPHDVVSVGSLPHSICRIGLPLCVAARSGDADLVADLQTRLRPVLRLGEHPGGEIGAEFVATGVGHCGTPERDLRRLYVIGAG